ncbi:MAG: 5-(carboxyamino)imidazole ribonucleotide synthase [Clostridia bacterium]|jgi:5-(carboxyamino)imidazole ribonucleotide synthase|nr:5-(carboxyamino)imidazole ribonucleotide synthase [Clostridia bacterium]
MLDKIRISPPFHIGIIGGGQLGKMMAVAAKQLGFYVTILDPVDDCPAAQVADKQILADFNNHEAIRSLVEGSQVTTYEFEHIDSQVLIQLEAAGYHIYPEPRNLQIIQNKLHQKQALQQAGIPVAPFLPVAGREDLIQAAENFGYPLLLKACAGGYDGKGNFLIKNSSRLEEALTYFRADGCSPDFGKAGLMGEAFISFELEVSVMVARSVHGQVAVYPLSENEHEDNILRRSLVPARVSREVANRAQEIADKVINLFNGVGIFCIEMFVTPQGEILINEVAPRPHNSGHYTIEANITSQFEQHIRAIAGLPLGDARLREPAVMINLLGEPGQTGPAVLEGCSQALAIPGVHLHFYGKKETVPKRKMGHITVTAPTLEEAIAGSDEAARVLRVISSEGSELNVQDYE